MAETAQQRDPHREIFWAVRIFLRFFEIFLAMRFSNLFFKCYLEDHSDQSKGQDSQGRDARH